MSKLCFWSPCFWIKEK